MRRINRKRLVSKCIYERRRGTRVADASDIGRLQAHFGAENDFGFECVKNPAEIGFGFAIALNRRGVEIIDPQFQRPTDDALLFGTRRPGH